MALTPRSLLRSPVLLLALVISAGMALVGTMLFLAVFMRSTGGPSERVVITTIEVDQLATLRGGGCDHLLRDNGSELGAWQHDDWVVLATCFENGEDFARSATAAATGLGYFPTSETLHNIRGYDLIVLEEFEKAVSHLRVALQSVEPTTSTMQNNLAWAGLFVPERMTLTEARRLYRAALERDATSCETLHTGMWVEYGIASQTSGSAARDAALGAYADLRARYEPCTDRVYGGAQITGFEVAGAGILDGEIHKLKMIQMFERNEIDEGFAPLRSDLVRQSLPAMGLDASQVLEACEDIAPVASARPACRKELVSALAR